MACDDDDDPGARAAPRATPAAEHANLPADASVWAAARRPQETLQWLRAVREADRVAERIDRALAGRSPANAFRAAFYRGDSAAEDEEARRRSTGGDAPTQG